MGKILIFAGCLFLIFGGFLFHQRYSPAKLVIASYKASPTVKKSKRPTQKVSVQPVSIQIPSLKINLPIKASDIKNGQWEVSSTGVSYLRSSPIPGDIGNSILYGHNWTRLLGRLPEIKPGAMITIRYSNGSIKKFETSTTGIVSPDQVGILDPSKDRRITIYTCIGFLDSQRFVAVAIMK